MTKIIFKNPEFFWIYQYNSVLFTLGMFVSDYSGDEDEDGGMFFNFWAYTYNYITTHLMRHFSARV